MSNFQTSHLYVLHVFGVDKGFLYCYNSETVKGIILNHKYYVYYLSCIEVDKMN